MKNPATVPWGLSISDADFAKIKRGVRCRSSDDKWVVAVRKAEPVDSLDAGTATGVAPADDSTTDEELSGEEEDAWSEGSALDEAAATTDDEEPEEEYEYFSEDDESDEEEPVDLTRGDDITIIRSWSQVELFRLAVRPRTNEGNEGTTSATIQTITWEQNQHFRCISGEEAKIDVILLFRQILDCDLEAAPDYDASDYSGDRRSIHSAAVDGTSEVGERGQKG